MYIVFHDLIKFSAVTNTGSTAIKEGTVLQRRAFAAHRAAACPYSKCFCSLNILIHPPLAISSATEKSRSDVATAISSLPIS